MSTSRGLLARISVLPITILVICTWLLILQFHPQWGRIPSVDTPFVQPPPVEIVVASLKSENTSWVHRYLPGWSRRIYIVDDLSAPLTVPRNKGREAMVYLSHIIDSYDAVAQTTIFVHASRFAWHNDDPDYDGLATLRNLQLDYVQASGYVNLRCVWTLGCPVEIRPHSDAATDWEIGNGTSSSVRPLTTKEIYKRAFEELMPGLEVPQQVGVSCCSQFAVSREAIHSRPREDYIRWREWLLETPLADDLSGRVFEYLWHIIFRKEAVFCPSAAECYCKLYGLCNLRCDEYQCDGRYVLPKYSTMPDGWPRFGWSGEERHFTGPL
ncbi:hypothetical protein C8A03DRAFT_11876 [Achaetomium macrosporum]|uniref:Uncharacterized protein n=1 Tax=Achaetomium macrosporum TaxID=79813 RepID=A0AAN7HE95_9PEZI|nr:hypothetical protein C8A03DRAFT_11876 [Achaetomium macrosporum]